MLKQALERAMKRLKDGDQSAFDTIYDETHKIVYFVIHRILNDAALSEDVMQETYMSAVKNIGSYQAVNPAAWLTTIAKNLALNEYNRRKRFTPCDFNELADCTEGNSGIPDEDSFGLIKTAEKLLDETDFQIVVMCAVSGYKRREAAEILNMPISTVTYRYKQALETLKQELNKGGRTE